MSPAGDTLAMRDRSRAGHVLATVLLERLPPRATVRAVVEHRIRGEVAAYNAAPGPVYHGFVAPEDATRYSDGLRMRRPRPLDADRAVQAAEEAIAAGLVAFELDGRPIGPDDEVVVADATELVAVLQRPVVARLP